MSDRTVRLLQRRRIGLGSGSAGASRAGTRRLASALRASSTFLARLAS
jgi:hypothetical protein